MRHRFGAKYDRIFVRPLDFKDLEPLREWRNNNQVSMYLRKIEYISVNKQFKWFEDYLEKEDLYFWAIQEDDKLIGSLAIYNIHDDYSEVGKIMIGDCSARGKGYGYCALVATMKIGFEFMKLHKFHLVVYEENVAAIKTYLKAGFSIVGSQKVSEGACEYMMEIEREKFYESKEMVSNINVFLCDDI